MFHSPFVEAVVAAAQRKIYERNIAVLLVLTSVYLYIDTTSFKLSNVKFTSDRSWLCLHIVILVAYFLHTSFYSLFIYYLLCILHSSGDKIQFVL